MRSQLKVWRDPPLLAQSSVSWAWVEASWDNASRGVPCGGRAGRRGDVREIGGYALARRFFATSAILRSRIGAQPQRRMRRLHRLPHHFDQVTAQGVQVCLVPELGREGF